ncbi:MAG: hypothetical protein ACK413_02225 [Patescibacteria group bacterium]
MFENTPQKPEKKEEIHVMPDYLKEKKLIPRYFGEKKKKSFPLWIIWIFIGLVIITFSAIFYFQPNLFLSFFVEKKPPPPINQPPVVNIPEVINKEKIPSPEISPSQTLKAEIKKDERVIISAELYLPEGALPVGEKIELSATESFIEEEKYKIIGGIFKIYPLIEPLKPLIFKISYSEDIVEPRWEDDLKIGYLKEGFWIILPTEVDVEKNTISTTLFSLPSSTFAALVLKEKTVEKKEVQEIAPGIVLAEDSDNDGLTDKEEEIYQTDKNNPDTDNDGYPDGSELINLFSPIQGYGAKLADSNLIKIYTNETFGYSLFYPSSFIVKVMPESGDKEVIISSEIGEFFSLVVQENPEMLPVEEWYKKQISELGIEKLTKTKVDNEEAIWSLDGLTLYIGKKDKIFVFSYNIGGQTTANFKSTYLMMVKSFKFLE